MSATAPPRAARVLIVDDHPLNLELAGFLLGQAGMSVRTAAGGEEALVQLAREAPDLLLLDMQMPGMDGLTLAGILRRQARYAALVIVAFTAYAMKGDREKFLAAGCNGYIPKPIDVARFADEVRALLPHG